MEVLLTENRAQNKIESLNRTHWEMKQRETLTNEQARERIAMDCSSHEHARKPQPEDEFHKVVPGVSPSSHAF